MFGVRFALTHALENHSLIVSGASPRLDVAMQERLAIALAAVAAGWAMDAVRSCGC
jgi:hypothetical protein